MVSELGYVEGKNVVFEYRWAQGKSELFPKMAADLVQQNVDVIVASSQAPALAAKRATTTIPIVMVNTTDPVEVGLVASLAYLMANNLSKAEEHLAALQRICLIPCEEYEDLKKAVADYRARAPK
jgi:ABC-type uncharacterized transport system substrate-binding protein